jgi:sortase A
VAVLVVVGLAGGGVGVVVGSNALATSQYAARITAGDDLGVLTIPRFGPDWAVPILAGTSWETLRQGVGWYEGTAEFGQIGNTALAGHRLGWGQPFAHLDQLQVGDEIQLATAQTTYVYVVVTGPTVVAGDDPGVLAPVPGDPERPPAKSVLTLTTAATWLPTPNRLVVIAELSVP